MKRSILLYLSMVSIFLLPVAMTRGAEEPLPTVAEKVEGLETNEGLLTFHLDRQRGKVLLEVPPAADPAEGHVFLYVEGLTAGLGSNPIGLDRGQIGPARLVGIRRVGGRVFVEEQNLGYRALSENSDERKSVREAFARSVLWGGEIVAEDEDGTMLVDFTSFIVRDAHHSAATLEQTGQGAFALDPNRSAVDIEQCLAFPDNLEFEAVLTFGGKEPGRHVRGTVPDPRSVTLTQHHSLLRLPEDGYQTRRLDPRTASFAITFQDYAVPLEKTILKQWIVRHRLEKKNPKSAKSRAVEPIIYYVDRGAPEPVRSALIEGASWWAEAFEAAGFVDAFQVKVLPEGAHPLDVRYNVIQWVHRSTRGWSYGGGVIDPRTGEMIKGHVSLGSLRVRQDRLLFEGLAGTAKTGTGDADDPVELALARIRQLSAHEVGHTLGFAHNFAASTYAGRASVMDYPAPLIGVGEKGELDFSQAYGVGIGVWDIHATRYAYTQFREGADEEAELGKIIQEGLNKGYLFLSDPDARPAGAAHPLANLWDNGLDPVAQLEQTLEVRRIALENFGEDRVPSGAPLARLHEVLVPVYLHHRFQIGAAAKVLGGLEYYYAVRGDGQPPAQFFEPEYQKKALDVVLSALEPERLDLPEALLQVLLPRSFGIGPNRELFQGRTGPIFDPMGAAASAAKLAIEPLLQKERAARLIDFHRRDRAQPGFQAVLKALIQKAFPKVMPPGRLAVLSRIVQGVAVEEMIHLANDENATPGVRALVDQELTGLIRQLRGSPAGVAVDESGQAHRAQLAATITRHLTRPAAPVPDRPTAPDLPPGSPIGEDSAE